jgi:meiotic recombination protein SPO11
MESTTTLFILVVESNVTLSALHSAKVQETYRCIIVSGSEVPDTSTRKFLRRVSLTLKLPVLALTDGDTYGFLILLNYNKGSKQMAYDSENLATPNMYWLGVRPSDRRRYNIRDSYIKSLTDKELECVRSLLQKPYVKNNVDWTKELRIMLKTQTKIEIEATHSISVKWLTETYLSKKLKLKRWWRKQVSYFSLFTCLQVSVNLCFSFFFYFIFLIFNILQMACKHLPFLHPLFTGWVLVVLLRVVCRKEGFL